MRSSCGKALLRMSFYSLPSLKNSFLPKEIYNAKENREGIESTVNRSDEAS